MSSVTKFCDSFNDVKEIPLAEAGWHLKKKDTRQGNGSLFAVKAVSIQ